MVERRLTAPEPTPETAAFWQAAAAGKLLIRRCAACRRAHWYPRVLCPFCLGETAWEEASGSGTIYSVSVMERAPVPYAVGYVTLAEGPTMLTNFTGCDLGALRIGQAVRAVFVPTESGAKVPTFTPA